MENKSWTRNTQQSLSFGAQVNMATVITLFVATIVVIEVTESASSAWISPDCLKAVRSGNRECLNKSNEEKIKVCGKRSALSANIAGGEDTVPGEWPWMARLIYERDDVLCGGNQDPDTCRT